MKKINIISGFVLVLLSTGCSNEPKESDKLLSDYKKQQLEKAKKVEEEMNKRVDNLNNQLEQIEEKSKDDPK